MTETPSNGDRPLATGVRPRISSPQRPAWRWTAGSSRRVHADEAPGMFAVGDIALAYNETAGAATCSVEHWGDALEHGGSRGW